MSDSQNPGGLPQDPERTIRGQLDLAADNDRLRQEIDLLKARPAKTKTSGFNTGAQVGYAGVTAIVSVLFFLFARYWAGWNFSIGSMVATTVGLTVLVGFMPQIVNMIAAAKPWIKNHPTLVTALFSLVFGLSVAIRGVKGDGWAWLVAFVSTFLGYSILCYFSIWYLRLKENSSKTSKAAAAGFYLLLISLLLAFFYHPVTAMFGKSAFNDSYTGPVQGPVEHLVNSVICYAALLATFTVIIGIGYLIVRSGLRFFASLATFWRETMVGMQNQPGYMTIAKIVVFAAAVLVGTLLAAQLWPTDGAKTGKALAICIGLIAFLGFQFVKGRLIAAADKGERTLVLFLVSLIIIIPCSFISSAQFYARFSAKLRLEHTIMVVTALEDDYLAKVTSNAESNAASARTQKDKDRYLQPLEEMRQFRARTKSSKSYRQVIEEVDNFKVPGGKLTGILDEGQEDALSKVKVAPEPDPLDLLAHALGWAKAPEGVERVYTGSAVGAFATALLAEWMVLILVIIIIVIRRRRKGDEKKFIGDGQVVSAMNSDGTHYLVWLSVAAARLMKQGAQAAVYVEDEMISAVEAKKPLGDGVWVFERNAAGRAIPNGAQVRVIS